MTVSHTKSSITYVGNGATTAFPTDFPLNSSDEVTVTLIVNATSVETVLSSAEYIIPSFSAPQLTTITYPVSGSPLASTHSIRIDRATNTLQPIDVTNQTRYDASVVMQVWDKLHFLVQELRNAVNGSLRVSDGKLVGPLTTRAADRGGRTVAFAADGQSIELGPTLLEMNEYVQQSADAAQLSKDWAEKTTAPAGVDTMSSLTAAKVSTASALASKNYRDQAENYANDAALYDGPKVDTFPELVSVTATQVDVGGLLRVVELDAVYERASDAATDADLNYSGSGGVKWYVLPDAEGVYQLDAFNDGSADAAPFVKKWMEKVFASRNGKGKAGGVYTLETLVDAQFPNTGSGFPVHKVSLEGGTFIVAASNTTGGIKITKHNNAQHLSISGLLVLSDIPIGVHGGATNGQAIEIYSALRPGDPGWGATGKSELLLENVCASSTQPGTKGRWDGGIKVDGFWWPYFVRCEASTRHPSDKTTKEFEIGDGILATNCYLPFFTHCNIFGRFDRGFAVTEDTGFAYEDFAFDQCWAGGSSRVALEVTVTDAALQAAGSKEPGGRIQGGHFNGQQYGINIEYRRQVTIDGVLAYTTTAPGQATYTDASGVRLYDCQDISVGTLSMPEGGHYTSDADCTAAVRVLGNSDYIHVNETNAGADGIGVFYTATGTNSTVSGTHSGGSTGSAPTKLIHDPSARLKGSDAYSGRTPTISFGGGSTGVTYGSRDGGFVKEGRVVTWWMDLEITSKGSSTGAAVIGTGLPGPLLGSDFTATVNFSSGVNVEVTGRINPSGDIALFKQNASGGWSLAATDADLTGTSTLKFSGSYIAA